MKNSAGFLQTDLDQHCLLREPGHGVFSKRRVKGKTDTYNNQFRRCKCDEP